MVLAAGPVAEQIPMPVIGGLILVIGGELIAGRLPDIRLVARTGLLPAVAMLVTFVATTQLPLQQAILLGAGLSLLLYCVNAQRSADIEAIARDAQGRWRTVDLPASLPCNAVTVLHYEGVSLVAEVAKLDDAWPDGSHTHHAVVILHARTVPDVPSSTIIKALGLRAHELTSRDCRLMVVGLDQHLVEVLTRTGIADLLGPGNLIARTPVFFESLDTAFDTATAWVQTRPAQNGDNT